MTYDYNKDNQIISVIQPQGTTTYEYDALGRPLTLTYVNGVTTAYEYQGDEQLVRVVSKKASGELINDLSYDYDENGNIVFEKVILPKVTQEKMYTYDEDDQLLSVTLIEGNDTIETSYMYDELGNRLFYQVSKNGKREKIDSSGGGLVAQTDEYSIYSGQAPEPTPSGNRPSLSKPEAGDNIGSSLRPQNSGGNVDSRHANKLKPDSNATTNHSVFKRDPSTGEITNYKTYEVNPKKSFWF